MNDSEKVFHSISHIFMDLTGRGRKRAANFGKSFLNAEITGFAV